MHHAWFLLAAIFTLLSFRRRTALTVIALTTLGLTAGVIRGQSFADQLLPYQTLYGSAVTLQAKAETDGIYTNNGQLDFDVSSVKILEPLPVNLPGKINIRALGVPAIYRGDIIEATGTLVPTGGSRQGRIQFASVQVAGRSGRFSDQARREFIAGMQTALPEPESSFGLGLLIGQRATLSEEVTKQLSIVGLTHIIAVSGYNLTIIVRGSRRLLGKRSKYQSFVISLTLITMFLVFTGFSASIVRASIVCGLSLLAWYYGRTFQPLLLLLIAAALTAGWSPLYIWSDLGWHLSFLAFFGVLILAPGLKHRFWSKKEPKLLMGVVLESLAAQVMTAPLILYMFHEVSLIALLANALIVPMVPLAMLTALLAGVGGIISLSLAGLFAIPGLLVLTYMLDLVSVMSKIPHALVERSISLGGMILIYCLIIFVVIMLAAKHKTQHGIITDKESII